MSLHPGTTRDPRLDLLRIVAAVAVVCIHVTSPVVSQRAELRDGGWWVGNLADSFSRWCVPVFVMVSGALMLSASRSVGILAFYKARARKLLVPLLFWSVFYVALRAYIDGQLEPGDALSRVARGLPHFHLWYVFMLLGLYVFVPFLQRFVAASSRSELHAFAWIGFGLAGICLVTDRLNETVPNTFVGLFVPYIPYLVLGHLLASEPAHGRSTGRWITVVAGSVAIALASYLLYPVVGPRAWDAMYEYLNPVVVLVSVAVFRLGMSSSIDSKAVRWLAPLTFGIYLIHPFWLMVLYKVGLHGSTIHPTVGIPATMALALGLSTTSVWAMSRLPYLRAVVPA